MLPLKTNFPLTRLRRMRQHPTLRALMQETILAPQQFILPLFIRHGQGEKKAINSMKGHFQLTIEYLKEEIEEIVKLNLYGVILFGIPEKKEDTGSYSYAENGIIATAIRTIKKLAPHLLIIADVCLCEYTTHGHCGIINKKTGRLDLDNDATLAILKKQAISFVNAGADVIAPSGMMDGVVKALRFTLDEHGFYHIPILNYSVKYCSSLYAPFREAAHSAPEFGDRKTYQMDPANTNEALREVREDINEGADIIMVKPAGFYLDVIYRIKQHFPQIPLAAYQVSGEFSMIKAAEANGFIDGKKVALESLIAIKRAGADFIISYFAKEVIFWLKQ